jgi:hypothetical protein
MALGQLSPDFRQRQVRLVGDQRQHGCPVPGQPRATIASHGPSFGMTFGIQALRPSHRSAFTDAEPPRRCAC